MIKYLSYSVIWQICWFQCAVGMVADHDGWPTSHLGLLLPI